MKIHVDIKKLIIAILISATISLFLSYNLLFAYSNHDVFFVDNTEKAEEAKSLNNRDNLIEIKGTPNELFKTESSDGNIYFALKEYGNKIIIKDTKDSYKETTTYKGNFDKLKFVPNADKLISELNTPINLNEELGTDLNLTEDQNEAISNLTASDFNEDTIIIFAKHTDNNTLMKVLLESVGIFLLVLFGISVVLRVLKFDHEYWDFDDGEARRKN